jgi:glycerophosphoryl diester phosphodiesterase
VVAAVRDLGFSVPALRAAGFPVVPWTVDGARELRRLLELGATGVITDRPDLLIPLLETHGGGSLVGPDGLLDPGRFDLQAHRGARGLRPENTLPSMEAALDLLVTTLEMDVGLTADGVVMVGHEPWVAPKLCRRLDGRAFRRSDRVLVREQTARQIQETFVCDRRQRGLPQANDPALSPAAVAFASCEGLVHPYVMPTLAQVFDFTRAYAEHYRSGGGAAHPDAARRAANARRVRFSVEVKADPGRTAAPEEIVRAVAGLVEAFGLERRTDVQSFDPRALEVLAEEHPSIRRAYLFRRVP